jgi:hypothetical protein
MSTIHDELVNQIVSAIIAVFDVMTGKLMVDYSAAHQISHMLQVYYVADRVDFTYVDAGRRIWAVHSGDLVVVSTQRIGRSTLICQ